jgi:hypothetical protein
VANETALKTRHPTEKLRYLLDSPRVDPFTLVVVAGLGVVVLALWLLGRYYPGSGLEQLGLKSDRELTERREELEADDLDQMLRAHNARKRARGEPEVTAEQLEARVLGEMSGRGRREE